MNYDFTDLSPARQKKIFDICTQERKDAALNGVIIGLKCMNQIHGFGLERLAKLSTTWGNAITDWYTNTEERHREGFRPECVDAGDLLADVDTVFFDLSESRRRKIKAFLNYERKDAEFNACMIGVDTIKKELHFGEGRLEPLLNQWQYDIRDFYQDREINEPRLKEWIEDIGFCFDGGKLQTYRANDGKLIKKSTVERWEAEDAEKKI